MKPTTIFFALTLIFLSTKPSQSSRSIFDDTVVYDASGNPLEKDATYFISPPIWGPLGGRVMLSSALGYNQTCAADVLQSPFEVAPGTPFTFTPVSPLQEDAIKLGYPVAIQSPTENPCEEGSTVWKVSTRIGVYAEIITTGGTINTPDSCIRITRPRDPLFPYSYALEYCPFMCGAGFKICKPIGIYTSNHKAHLSPSGSSFEIVFLKASGSAAI
uniref:kunitz trypsin inhibitor 5-like n=1 Tax=Erigeron canadensis TaxID=72917 RepID=UPI001CB8D38B|nr:kunitz trypsin inhibitor 5-like [Erigeron canadensis]